MKDVLKRMENENDFQYKVRLCVAKLAKEIDLDWCELVTLLGLDCSADHLRKLAYGYKEYTAYLDSRQIDEITENDIVKEIEEKTKLMEKEKIKFQDQKREYKNYLRQDARFEHLVDVMKKEIEKLNDYRPFYNSYYNTYEGLSQATLILSDLHIGLEVENRFNSFNKKIAKDRLDRLAGKVIQYCKRHGISTLHVELLGDIVNGYIHLGTRISNEEDVISQVMTAVELLSNFIHVIAEKIPNIKIYSTVGNHGRCMPNMKDSLDLENFERLVPWGMKMRLECENVEFIDNKEDDEIIVYEVLNQTIISCHGHKEKMGTVISDFVKLLKIFPDEVHMGHFHRHSTLEDNDIELVINGSFSGTDEYAKSIRKSNKPSQTLIIYNEQGQECLYKITL